MKLFSIGNSHKLIIVIHNETKPKYILLHSVTFCKIQTSKAYIDLYRNYIDLY